MGLDVTLTDVLSVTAITYTIVSLTHEFPCTYTLKWKILI